MSGRKRGRRGRLAVAVALGAVAAWAAPTAHAQGPVCDEGTNFGGAGVTSKPTTPLLDYGIYPGGGAGQVGPLPAGAAPEVQSKIDAALAKLRPAGRDFVVHLYGHYGTPQQAIAEQNADAREIAHYTSLGYLVEYVIRYKPDQESAASVPAYVEFVRGIVRRFGPNRRFVGLQVTNEANFTGSTGTSDGAFAGAPDALVRGVIAAKDELRKRGHDHLEVGFNWFYRMPDNVEYDFWGKLRDKGGKPFLQALDWVGVDAYPGTFFPPTSNAVSKRAAIVNAFEVLRDCFLPVPGIPDSVPLHVGENGWPTSPPSRTYEQQKAALEEMVKAVHDARQKYNVSSYRWFDLRDAETASPNFQQQYGITKDDYTPKVAFASYDQLVEQLAAPARPQEPAKGPAARLTLRLTYGRGTTRSGGTCARRNVLATVVGPGSHSLVRRADFSVGQRSAGSDEAPPLRRFISRSSLEPGAAAVVAARVQLRVGGARTVWRAFRACRG